MFISFEDVFENLSRASRQTETQPSKLSLSKESKFDNAKNQD